MDLTYQLSNCEAHSFVEFHLGQDTRPCCDHLFIGLLVPWGLLADPLDKVRYEYLVELLTGFPGEVAHRDVGSLLPLGLGNEFLSFRRRHKIFHRGSFFNFDMNGSTLKFVSRSEECGV